MSEELALCWQNLSLYIPVKPKTFFKSPRIQRIKLLHNVSGIVKSGTLSAVMGPSGSGKTTLLTAISQRSTGQVSGDIFMNGHPVDKELMVRMSGFVPQQDLAITSLTVYEHLNFMANLKMDCRVSRLQRSRIVEGILHDLGLSGCLYTRLSDLSGGERKRVSLAVQLVTDPPVLMCDEPTTGLDSCTAGKVVALLRELAGRGKAVLCSLHQPASGIFELFDTVTLLVPGGKMAYFGEVNSAEQYFSQMGFICPPSYNTAEYVVAKLNTLPEVLEDEFTKSSAFVNMHRDIASVKKSLAKQHIFGIEEKFLKFYSVQKPNRQTQLKWLLWRSAIELYRNSQKVLLRLCMYIFTGLLVSMPYVGVKIDQEGIQNLQGLNYSVITETIFCHAYAMIHTFPAEIPILLREIGSGVYQPAPYYLSKVCFSIARVIVETLLFLSVVQMIAGVNAGLGEFLVFAVPVIASAIASSAYGCCISAMFESISTASLLSVPIDFISYCFSGIFLQLATVPLYLSWIKYISRFYYGLEAISILQWSNVEDIPCSSNPSLPCISTGEGVLKKYGYNPNNLTFDLLGLLTMSVLLHLVGFLFLKKRSQKQSAY